MSESRGTIALLFAMRGEAERVIDSLSLRRVEVPEALVRVPFEFYRGVCGGDNVVVSLNGLDARFGVDNIGLEPAALNAFATVQGFRPDVVISAGTAGSFGRLGASVGRVYFSGGAFVFHDRRIPLSGFEAFARGGFPSLDVSDLASLLGCATGVVSSGSSLDYTDAELERFFSSGARVKEMEAAAAAWACSMMGVPFFAIKSVTNLIDVNADSPGEFVRNFDIAVGSLTDAVVRAVRCISERGVREWVRSGPRGAQLTMR